VCEVGPRQCPENAALHKVVVAPVVLGPVDRLLGEHAVVGTRGLVLGPLALLLGLFLLLLSALVSTRRHCHTSLFALSFTSSAAHDEAVGFMSARNTPPTLAVAPIRSGAAGVILNNAGVSLLSALLLP
jgi:hypothetical protein